jgi:hypothetical protein
MNIKTEFQVGQRSVNERLENSGLNKELLALISCGPQREDKSASPTEETHGRNSRSILQDKAQLYVLETLPASGLAHSLTSAAQLVILAEYLRNRTAQRRALPQHPAFAGMPSCHHTEWRNSLYSVAWRLQLNQRDSRAASLSTIFPLHGELHVIQFKQGSSTEPNKSILNPADIRALVPPELLFLLALKGLSVAAEGSDPIGYPLLFASDCTLRSWAAVANQLYIKGWQDNQRSSK